MEPELLDQTDVSPADRKHAYDGLDRLQRWGLTARRLYAAARPTLQAAIASDPNHRPRWVDLACGSGRILTDVVQLAAADDITLDPYGVDFSDKSLDLAQANAAAAGVEGITWVRSDLVADPMPEPAIGAEVVSCSLFLHHLETDAIVAVLAKAAAAGQLLLVDDLRRNRRSFAMAWLGGRLLTRSRIVQIDGAISVRAGLEPDELRAIADDAGLQAATITTQWPQRMVLTHRQPEAAAVAQPALARAAG